MNKTRVILLVTAIIVVSLGAGGAWLIKRNAAEQVAKTAAAADKPTEVVIVETPIERLFKRAQADDVTAQVRLAQLYLTPEPAAGFNLTKNQSLAFSWYQRAAENGDAEAQFRVAEMYLAGRGVPFDTTKAMASLAKAAEQNHIDAAVRLGLMYAPTANGRHHDVRMAAKWLNAAADLGSPRAEAALDGLRLAGRLPSEAAESDDDAPNIYPIRQLTERWLNDLNRHISGGNLQSRRRSKISIATNGVVSIAFRRLRLTFDDGEAMLIGDLRLDIEPKGDPDPTTGTYPSYRFVGALSPRFAITRNGEPDILIKHTPSRFVGEWRPDLAMFTDFEIRLGNIKIAYIDKNFAATISDFAILSDLRQSGNGKWSGRPFAVEIAGLSARDSVTGRGLELAKMSLGGTVAGLDLAQNQKFLGDFKTMSLKDWFTSVLLRAIESQPHDSMIAGEGFDWRVKGLNVFADDSKKLFGLGEAHFSLDVADLDKPLGRINLALGGGGIEFNSENPALNGLSPTQAELKASLVRLPAWEAARVLVKTAFDIGLKGGISQTATTSGGFDQRLFATLAEKIPALIAAARSGLQIDLRAERGAIAVQFGSELLAHMKPPGYLSGTTNLWIEGVEALEKSAAMVPEAAALQRLKPFGEQTTHNKRPALRFQIKLTPDGRVLINGEDASAVVQVIGESLR